MHRSLGLIAAASSTLGFVLIAGCGAQSHEGTGVSRAGHPQVHQVLGASWAGDAHSISDLAHESDAIVEGTVASVADTGIHEASGGVGYPYTDFTINVTQWLKGSTSQGTVTVHQTGGEDASGALETVEDDPLLQVGDQAFYFLHEYAPGQYYILQGPTGRFPLTQGQVTALPGGQVTDGLPESAQAFIAQVEHDLSS